MTISQVCVAGVFFVLVVHVICCGMSKLRSTIHTKLFVQKSVHGHHELCKNHALIDHENASNFTAIDLK